MDPPDRQSYVERKQRTEGFQPSTGTEKQARGHVQSCHGPFPSNGRGCGRENSRNGRGGGMYSFQLQYQNGEGHS